MSSPPQAGPTASDAADAWNFIELFHAVIQAPSYHLLFEFLLIAWIVRLLFTKSAKSPKIGLSEKEQAELLAEWVPEPLVPETPQDHPALLAVTNNIVSSKPGKHVTIQGHNCLNLASLNFLGMIGDESVERVAVENLRKYGVGSCGPRGFYGTVDVHLELEEELARYMKCEEAVLYSYGFPTIASAIPAYCKRGDVVFVDEGVHFSIQQGILASRSRVMYFRHNDLQHLRELLDQQRAQEAKDPKKASVTRKFLVVEGLYINYGDTCPLPELVSLKYEYKVRIFLEESGSFGVLGQTGRGVTEHYGVNVDDVDLIAASLENAVGGNGGFCCGKSYVIDHQRLSGQGYCFSASLPPMLAAACSQALSIMTNNADLFGTLRHIAEYTHHEMTETIPGLYVSGDAWSPIKHLRLEQPSGDAVQDLELLQAIVDKAREEGVALTVARYLTDLEHAAPHPSIRLALNCKLTEEEVGRVVAVLKKTADELSA